MCILVGQSLALCLQVVPSGSDNVFVGGVAPNESNCDNE